MICGDWLSNEAMKPSKLLCHVETKHPAFKTSLWSFSKEKNVNRKDRSNYLKATTSSNVSALRASFLVANRIAKATKPFTAGEELILPAAKEICREFLGEAAVKKVAHVPLLASTVTRQIDEMAEDTEAQLLERSNESPGTQSRLTSLLILTTRPQCVFMCDMLFRRMCMRICHVHFSCQPTPQLQNFPSL